MAKESAEQKLLKLIESTDSQEGAASTPHPTAVPDAAQQISASVKSAGLPSVSVPPFAQGLITNIQTIIKNPSSLGLKEVNKILAMAVTVIAIIFVIDFLGGMRQSKEEIFFEADGSVPVAEEGLLPTFRDLAEYANVIARRNIFHPYEEKVPAAVAQVPAELKGKEKIAQQLANYKLVGISWLDTPDSASAMLENTLTGITYFVKTGEKIKSVMIKEIFADSITVTFEGEEMEMRL